MNGNRHNMIIAKKYRILGLAFLLSIVLGVLSSIFYSNSPKNAIDIKQFNVDLNRLEQKAEKTLDDLSKIIIHNTIDSVYNYSFSSNEIAYYVFENGNLVFWSDNHTDIRSIKLNGSTQWHYQKLKNAYCIVKNIQQGSFQIAAVIVVKYNFPFENKHLSNIFNGHIDADKSIELIDGLQTDPYAVFTSSGNYLFSLQKNEMPIYNDSWGYLGFICFSLAFLLLIYIYVQSPEILNKKKISIKQFVIISLFVSVIVALSMYFGFPNLLYWNHVFSSFEYASNPLLASIGHLSIATVFFTACSYLFFFRVRFVVKISLFQKTILQFVFVIFYLLVYYILYGIVAHSSIQLVLLQFQDITFLGIWVHWLMLLWGISLTLVFFKTHPFKSNNNSKKTIRLSILIDVALIITASIICLVWIPNDILQIIIPLIVFLALYYSFFSITKRINIYGFAFIWVLVFELFFLVNSIIINQDKNSLKYSVLAENIFINGNIENDNMAEILLEELDSQLSNDVKLKNIAVHPDSINKLNEYLNSNYLGGFWNKYDMRVNVLYANSLGQIQYQQLLNQSGIIIKNTHFYSIPASNNAMTYLGRFNAQSVENDSIIVFLEFYPRKNFKSYSFPELLISNTTDIQANLQIAVAKYHNNELIYASQFNLFPQFLDSLSSNKSKHYTANYDGGKLYLYQPNATDQIAITQLVQTNLIDYIYYFLYTLLIYSLICWFFVWLFLNYKLKSQIRFSLTAKFQFLFIILLILSFLGIFYVSVNYIQKKYEQEQISHIDSKKNYIQKALQDSYFWITDLSLISRQKLNFDLQELSYIYQTDIHVYDIHGELVGSSQPLLFNKHLISRQISSVPYFKDASVINQKEHIGSLEYLTGYTDFLNGDYLQLGFIAVPQFMSQEETQREIEGFLSVIIHIYLIIIILAVLISLFIGRQLSAPMKLIESKLREMRFGHRNEKIDYRLNDEIGQLVSQYNKTVDELEKSANLLAQTERELAWKTMARQIAHEINNPLTPMKLTIQQLQRTKKMGDENFDAYFEKSSQTLIEQIDNLSRIAGTFSNFARMPEAQFSRVDLAAKVYSTVQLYVNNQEHIKLNFIGKQDGIYILADGEQLSQVFNNLIKNAIQSIPYNSKGVVNISIEHNIQEVTVKIEDNGCGVPIDIAEKLFTPNFTTKNTGMGLGLTISKNIIEITGGRVSFVENELQGTTFIVVFPRDN